MKKLDDLLQSSGWRGSLTRFAIVGAASAGIYWLPYAYAWYSEHFLSRPVIVREHRFEMMLVYVFVSVLILAEAVNAIRILWMKRKARKERQ